MIAGGTIACTTEDGTTDAGLPTDRGVANVDAGTTPDSGVHKPGFVGARWCGAGKFDESGTMYDVAVNMRFPASDGPSYTFTGTAAYSNFCCDGRLGIEMGELVTGQATWKDGMTFTGGPFTPGQYRATFSTDEQTLTGEWLYLSGGVGGTFVLTSTSCPI